MSSNWWMIVPGNVALSGVLMFLIAMPFLYAARTQMHGMIRAASRAISNPMRIASRFLNRTADEMRSRNRAVMMAHGRKEMEDAISHEFEHIAVLVKRDLHGYPELQRRMSDSITKIEEDYKKCGEVPPPPPEWAKAIESISDLQRKGSDGLVEKLLDDISKSMGKIYDKALSEYRKSYEGRHKILKSFSPHWRSLDQNMTQADKKIGGLSKQSEQIDQHMEKYEQIIKKSDKAEAMLAQSASKQFIIDTVVMVIAVLGAYINSRLIELPMREMVGAGDYLVGNITVSDVASMVIIFVEATMGIFLMETAGITHLFPKMSSLNHTIKRRIFWISLTILVILAGIEVALAVMRDFIAADNAALRQQLSGDAAAAAAAAAAAKSSSIASHIPMIGQMVLGGILPFALAFVAIPLESFITSARTVFGMLMVLVVRLLALVFRVVGNIFRQIGVSLINFYDVVVFIPLVIEGILRSKGVISEKRSHDRGGVASFAHHKKSRTATGEL
ncbi:MAG: hypothetical protein OEZ10_14225 [Gammaproteobacteria bacterium]|nr:hypothetical protein [Gammaproteobacteria bacterium]